MKLNTLVSLIEEKFPLAWQENYDNSGLLLGDQEQEINKILCALDCTEQVADEAAFGNFDLVVTHHPLIFNPLSNLVNNAENQALLKLIKNNLALYAAHTNLDNAPNAINHALARLLGLRNTKIMLPKENTLSKLITFVPPSHLEQVKTKLSAAGAGKIGDYSECSFYHQGTGSFRPSSAADPFLGTKGELTNVEEYRLEMIFSAGNAASIIGALKASHPYEEPAYDIIRLANPNFEVGSGIIGDLKHPLKQEDFLKHLKDSFALKVVRYTNYKNNLIKKVALVSGAGFFGFQSALKEGADAFITAEVKHHEFLVAKDNILLCDIGHYESEIIAAQLLADFLKTLSTKLKVAIAQNSVNPVNFYF